VLQEHPRLNWAFNQQGYLLLETLLTASIFLILFPLVTLKVNEIYEAKQFNLFIDSFEATLYHAQMTALSEHRFVFVQMNNTSHEVYTYNTFSERLQTLNVPSNVQFQRGNLSLTLRFSPDGNITQAGSLYILSNQLTYKLTLLLGQGRFYVEKQ
jgi:competence protein ComGD